MAVSLVKIPVAAANSKGARIFLNTTFGLVPVRVDNVRPASPGRVTIWATTVNGAILSLTYPAGRTFSPAPAWRFA